MKTLQHKRGTAAIIAANNPVVPAGEFVIETDTGKGKVGDGSTAWASLPYAFPRYDGPLGTANAPTFTFTSDTNTGVYSPGADQWAVATGGAQRLHINSTGDVGIGTTAAAAVRLYSYQTATNQNGYVGHQVFVDPISTATGNYSHFGAYYILRTDVATGVTDGGAKRGFFVSAQRNNKGASNTDAGTLTYLRGAEVQYGHGISNTALTPTTTQVIGMFFSPLAGHGTITAMYDLYIDAPAYGVGTVGNHWALYQGGSTQKNWFAGNVGIGALRATPSSALDVNGVITTALGSVSAPALTFTADPNTGIYSPGADQVGIVTGGVSRLSANATGVVQVPGTGTSYFQVDADGQIRIGNTVVTNSLRYVDIANTDAGTNAGAIMRLITQNASASGNTTADFVKYRNGAFYINNNETTTAGFIGFQIGGTEDMRITQAGFVGIGRTAPASALDVNGVITVPLGTAALPSIVPTGDTDTGIYSPGADQLGLSTGGTARLTVAANGAVNTTGDFTCGGTLRTSTALQSTGGRSLFRAINEPYAVGSAYSATSGFVYFGAANESATPDARISGAGGGSLMYLQNGGNVGIGTTTPATRLEVAGQITVGAGSVSAPSVVSATGTADTGIYFPGTDIFAVATAGANRIYCLANGRVGIGTSTTPQALLGVNQAGNFGTDFLSVGSGTVAYPTAQYSGQAGFVSKGSVCDGRMLQQDGNGRLNTYWNAYSDVSTGNSWKYQVGPSEPAGRQAFLLNGTVGFTHAFYGAPAGAAGSAITWTQVANMGSGTGGSCWFSPRATNSDLHVNLAGDVGVGTNAPTFKLHVVGNSFLNGDLTTLHYTETVAAIGNSGTAKTIALTSGTVQTCTLTGNCTFTMPTATAGKSFTVLLKTGAGSFTATFTGVKWPGNVAPTITATASKLDLISFIADGTNWYGNIAQNYTP